MSSSLALKGPAASVTASFSGLEYDRAAQTFNSVLTLTNTGATGFQSPLWVVISTGNGAVTVSGSSDGSTYVAYIPGGALLPGQVAKQPVAFADPSRIAFTPSVRSVTSAPTVSTVVGSSVPTAASGLITTFYSASTTVPVGGAIPLMPDGAVPLLFAGDGTSDPLLFAVGSTTGVLDASTTAIGLVRVALGLVVVTPPLTSSTLESAIQSSPHYPKLLADVNTALEAGQTPLNSSTASGDAVAIAQDVIVTLNTSGALGATAGAAKIKTAATQVNAVPYYFINSSEPYNRLWLADAPGTTNVNAMNQTFIAWQFDSSDSNGPLASQVIAQPLQPGPFQNVGYYGGSASTTPVLGSSPEFTLTLSQSATTKNLNALSATNQVFVFFASALSAVLPNDANAACFKTAASSLFAPQLATLVAQPSGSAALNYFVSFIDPSLIINVVNQCVNGQSASLTGSIISAVWGKSAARLWTFVSLVRQGVSTVGTAAETFAYWDFTPQSVLICKTNGSVSGFPCVNLKLTPSAPNLAVGATVTLTASATNSAGDTIPVPPNLKWTSTDESVATVVDGVVTGIAAGSATITAKDPVTGASADVTVMVGVLFTQDLATWQAAAGTYINTTSGYGLTSTTLGSGSVMYPAVAGFSFNSGWCCGYTGETMINIITRTGSGPETITLTFKGLKAFGVQVEPNLNFGYDPFTVTLSNGQTITASIYYFDGAQFFGFVGDGITSMTISDNAGHAIIFGNFYSANSTAP